MKLFQTFYTSTDPNGAWQFVIVTLVLCGAAAYVTGKAIAETWRPFWQVVVYAVLIACACRFLHFALFHQVMLSLQNFIVDFIVLFCNAALGFTRARRRQMATQYAWPKASA